MQDQDSYPKKPGLQGAKPAYEPPKATVVRVQLQERVLGCLFSTIKVCGLTEP